MRDNEPKRSHYAISIMMIGSAAATQEQVHEVILHASRDMTRVMREHLAEIPDLVVLIPSDIVPSVDGDRVTLDFRIDIVPSVDGDRVTLDFRIKGMALDDIWNLWQQEGRA